MRRSTFLLAAVVFAGVAHRAAAQPQVPNAGLGQPAISPYLNLLRGGSSPAQNYFGLVRPEQQFRQQAQQLNQQLNQTNQNLQQGLNSVTGAVDANLPITGKGGTFMSYSHYFPALGGGAKFAPNGGAVGGGRAVPNLTNPVGQTGQAPTLNNNAPSSGRR